MELYLLYLLSLFCYHRLLAGAVRLQHWAERFSVSVASPSPLRGRWDCVLYVSECAHISVQVYYCRTSRFEQSCEPTDFCKAETISSQRTTEPTRRRQKTESGGFNSRATSLTLVEAPALFHCSLFSHIAGP